MSDTEDKTKASEAKGPKVVPPKNSKALAAKTARKRSEAAGESELAQKTAENLPKATQSIVHGRVVERHEVEPDPITTEAVNIDLKGSLEQDAQGKTYGKPAQGSYLIVTGNQVLGEVKN